MSYRKKFVTIGVDEAGRGPLAGPVAVCALAFLTPAAGRLMPLSAVRDSKQLSPAAREEWYARLRDATAHGDIAYAVSFAGASAIDRHGIVPSISAALVRALKRLPVMPNGTRIFLDGGLRAPGMYSRQTTVIRGDATVPAIALASIVAKVSRDRLMRRAAQHFPGYGFEIHKGYGTKAHYAALALLGPSPLHRRTFVN
jgi:ribonuclease HII